MPKPLLAADISEVETVGNISTWARSGVAGVIVRSDTLPDTQNNPAEYEKWHIACRKVRDRLNAEGIALIILRLPLPADRNILTDSTLSDTVLQTIRHRTEACREAGFNGLLLDADPASLIFDYRWDGYDWDRDPPPQLASAARRLGRRTIQAVRSAFPDADVLLDVADPAQNGPLWFHWFHGLVDGDAAAPPFALHVCIPNPATGNDSSDVQATQQRVAMRLEEPARSRFLDACGIAIRWDGAGPTIRPLLTAKLYSTRYFIIEPSKHNTAGWTELLRGTNDLLNRFERMGPLGKTEAGLAWYAVRSPRGAAAVFWDRLPDPSVFHDLAVPATAIDLSTFETAAVPPAGGRLDASIGKGPTLIDALPMSDWGAPACLWFDWRDWDPSAVPRIAYGLVNHTGFTLSGELRAILKPYGEVRPAGLPIDLAHGMAAEALGDLLGAGRPGDMIEVNLSLVTAGARPISRRFTRQIPPTLIWKTQLEGSVSGAPAVLRTPDGEARPAVATIAGEVVLLTRDGAIAWRQWRRGRFDTGPTVISEWRGAPLIVCGDHRGEVLAFDKVGRERWRLRTGRRGPVQPPIRARFHWFPGDELLITCADGTLTALLANGRELWRVAGTGTAPFVACADITGNGRDEVVALYPGPPHTAICLTHTGRLLWEIALNFEPDCVPLLADVDGDRRIELVLGGRTGEVELRDALFAVVKTRTRPVSPDAVVRLDFTRLDTEAGSIAAATQTMLYCLNPALEVTHQFPFPCGSAVAVPSKEHEYAGWIAAGKDGAVTRLSRDGRVIWRDDRFAAPVLAAPVMVDLDEDGAFEWLLASVDGAVWALAEDN